MTLPSPDLALRWMLTLGLGALGGWAALRIGAPLPWMLGGMAATAAGAMAGLRLPGGPLAFPMKLRVAFVPVIGVLIGAGVTPEVIRAIPGWWPALAAAPLFVVAAHAVNYAILRHGGGLSRPTAFFGGMPGGLLEAIDLGEKAGADVRALTLLQFARIAVTVTLVPLIFLAVEGRVVGSAAGQGFAAAAPLDLRDAAILAAAGVAGYLGARALGLPAGQILGPILASGAVHALGWTHAAPPPWLVVVAQLVIGVSLGMRFVGVDGRLLRRCLGLSLASVTAMLAIGAALAWGLSRIGAAGFDAGLLGLAPGGIVEMGLIALSLQASAVLVTAMHLVRILATVAVAVPVWAWLSRRA